MNKTIILTLCFFLFSCANTSKTMEAEKESSNLLTEQEKTYISQIETEGRLMYEKDIRAAEASDLLLSKVSPEDYPNFAGWVTYPNQDDFTVSFYEKDGESFDLIADVIYSSDGKSVLNLEPNRKPTNTEISMIKARILALEKGRNSCSDRFNTIVIPSPNQNEWDVYVIAATQDPKLIQVGGHVKVSVSKETSRVTSVVPLSKSCLALDKSGSDLPKGAQISELVVSHILGSMPIAIHPYINLMHNMPLNVATDRGLWRIKSGKISLQ